MKKQSSASEPSAVQVTPATVAHIGQLANLEISNQEQQQFAQAFTETLAEVQKIFAVDVSEVEPTHHVTGLVNVWRETWSTKIRCFPKSKRSQAPSTPLAK
ncbi:aspartyl/glutamyl-tRNA amidotransferase subunit C [Candidatus Woesebacteria bacterium]|nr:aspartyl/glutamyl-tRNA amidotransferase subunit C [Candidatus Woesebacteria bacterium]